MSYPRPTLYGTLYRWLMKLSHRYNWHHTRTYHPDGDAMVVCEWCGIRCVTARRGLDPIGLFNKTPTPLKKPFDINGERK